MFEGILPGGSAGTAGIGSGILFDRKEFRGGSASEFRLAWDIFAHLAYVEGDWTISIDHLAFSASIIHRRRFLDVMFAVGVRDSCRD